MTLVAALSAPIDQPRSAHVLLNILLVGLIAFLTVVDLFATQAILPALTHAYGTSPAVMSFAVNASTIGMAVAGLAMAVIGRRIDRHIGILLSLLLLSIPTLLLSTMPSIPVFIGLRILQGLCMVTAFTLTLAYVAETYSPSEAVSAVAAYITGNVASDLFGRLLSAAVADHFGYPLRLRMATKLGYKNPKWVTAIEVTNTYPGGFWESKGFPWSAGI